MHTQRFDHRTTARRADFIVAAIACGMLACVLGPALAQSRAKENGLTCTNHAKQIMLALHNYHDTRKQFPLASTRLITAKPEHFGDPDAAGYGWLFQLMPFMEEIAVYDQLVRSSAKLTKDLYDPTVTSPDGAGGLLSREHAISVLLCPSYIAHLTGEDEAAKEPAPDPNDKDANPLENVAKPRPKLPPISNYHALSGTHFYNKEGLGRLLPEDKLQTDPDGRVVPKSAYEGDGVIPFPGMLPQTPLKMTPRGLGLQSISDGTSKTLVFAETIEPKFANWLDGQMTWVVAAWPSNPDVPEMLDVDGGNGIQNLGWTNAQLPNNKTSLGTHGTQGDAGSKDVYLPAARWSGGADRVWGPSSYHDGKVTHAFADGSVRMLSLDIDPNVYLHLVTRSGREVIPQNAK